MKKPLHILYLARWYPHKFDDMYGLFVKRHAEAAAINHNISVFYVHACEELPSKNETEVHKTVISEYYYYYRKANTRIGLINLVLNGWQFLRGHMVLNKMIDKPDLIHVHILTRLGVLALLCSIGKNIPYIVTEHWSRYRPNGTFRGLIRKLVTRLVVSNASVFTTVTVDLKNSMLTHGVKNPNHMVLPNVVDSKVFFPANKTNRSEIKKLCHVSCFDDEPKNISGLVDCIKELSALRNDFVMEMIGTGRDLEKIMIKVNTLDLNNRIIFKGKLEGLALGEAVRSSDVLLLFSNFENMPVVINEAFCCGVPVLSTDVGGISEIVNSSNGILVAKGDQPKFVKELNHLLDHLDLYKQKEISEKANGMFSVMAISEKLNDIYLKNSYS